MESSSRFGTFGATGMIGGNVDADLRGLVGVPGGRNRDTHAEIGARYLSAIHDASSSCCWLSNTDASSRWLIGRGLVTSDSEVTSRTMPRAHCVRQGTTTDIPRRISRSAETAYVNAPRCGLPLSTAISAYRISSVIVRIVAPVLASLPARPVNVG